MISTKEHWQKMFITKAEDEVSWFQPYPKTSIEFLDLFNLPMDANIIDVGGGDSHFVDVLIKKGYSNLYVLDIADAALDRAKKRLGTKAHIVNWIASDIIDYQPKVRFDFWHDRAAFHFLTSEKAVDKYVSLAEKNIRPGGYLILGTFSENGPDQCSGLEIRQYTEASMSTRFEKGFERIKCIYENHTTPFHTTQNFLFCSFRKR